MNVSQKWQQLFRKRSFRADLFSSLAILFLGVLVVKITGDYLDALSAPFLPDIIHSLVFADTSFSSTAVFMLTQVLFWWYFIAVNPARFPAACAIYGIFMVVRGIFTVVTPIGAPLPRYDDWPLSEYLFKGLYYTQDLFPSGHVAHAFLGFLLVKDWIIKHIFLLLSITQAVVVVAAHQHYTIDVLGGYFVMYGVYALYTWLRDMRKKNVLRE